MNTADFIRNLLERFKNRRHTKRDRSGVYGFTQFVCQHYDSNKIEGSTLTEEQTASLFDTGILPKTRRLLPCQRCRRNEWTFFNVQQNVRYLGCRA